jgi:outer membrane biosynthesis protein TonB
MPGGLGPRFLIEAGFLIAVAVIAGLAGLDPVTIILVMAGACLLVAAVEWAIARARDRAEPAPVGAPAASVETEPEPAPEPEVTPGPSPEPTPEPEREPEASPEPAPPDTLPDQPPVAAVAPVPQPVPDAEPAPRRESQPRVVPLTPRTLGVPQQWNLWELERIARERGGADVLRDEERAFLLMYLREFAGADGVLPTSFDGIVREAFGDVLDAVGA